MDWRVLLSLLISYCCCCSVVKTSEDSIDSFVVTHRFRVFAVSSSCFFVAGHPSNSYFPYFAAGGRRRVRIEYYSSNQTVSDRL
jgi:Mlc titration factor MtfA (ptsG expression regulator)